MENIYDKTIKEIIEPALRPLINILLGIRVEEMQEVKDKIQVTIEREGDHLKALIFRDSKLNAILHLEFHVKDEDIGLLMLLKKSMLKLRLKLPVKQFVLYMGDKKKLGRLRDFYQDETTSHQFSVISLRTIPFGEFLKYDIPEVITLAILCDFGGKSPEEAIREILKRLDETAGGKKGASAHISRLEIFSNLRNLQQLFIQISNQMAFTYDLKKDLRYQQGKEEGMEKGMEKGIEKGIKQGLEQGLEEGILEEKIFSIRNMTKQGFSVEVIGGILDVSADFVLDVQKQLQAEPRIMALLEKKIAQPAHIAEELGVSIQLVRVMARVWAKGRS